MELDASGWSGDGALTQALVDLLGSFPAIRFLKVEDAPASRAEASFSFISNELYVAFAEGHRPSGLPALSEILGTVPGIGEPDYQDHGMLQYLRTERVIPPYQTRGIKVIELVRIYITAIPTQQA